MLFTGLAGSRVRIQGFGKHVQADVASGHVAEDRGDGLGIVLQRRGMIGALVRGQGLLETILPVINVSKVDIEASQPQRISLAGEYPASARLRCEGPIVFTHKDERLNGTAQGAGHLVGLSGGFEKGCGLLVMVSGSGVLALDVKDICFCPQSGGFGFLVFQFLRNSDGSIGEMQGARHIHSYLLYYFCGEFGDDFGLQQRAVLLEKLLPAGIVGETCQFLQQLLAIGLASRLAVGLGASVVLRLLSNWGHWNPFSSSSWRIFFRQRPGMKPIDPEAMPSSFATS